VAGERCGKAEPSRSRAACEQGRRGDMPTRRRGRGRATRVRRAEEATCEGVRIEERRHECYGNDRVQEGGHRARSPMVPAGCEMVLHAVYLICKKML
jgi:hypothetical protein